MVLNLVQNYPILGEGLNMNGRINIIDIHFFQGCAN